jgi:hypothetical protein
MTNKFTDNPVAMPNLCYNSDPAHKTLADSYQEWAANTQQVYKAYSQGQEDSGDVMSKQVGGNHYRKAIQPWDIIEEWQLNFWAGNVLKYLLRYPYKNGVEDLEKAKHYLEYLIKKEKDAVITARD